MKKGFIKRMIHGQRGITGLETAIILIAFVVVASVFAYTVLSSGLFSTQKAQEAVYGGLQEAQSTLQLKGSVVANGVAQLNNCDYLGWSGTNTTITRNSTEKMEGSASLQATVAAAAVVNDVIAVHAVDTMGLADGDTLSFFVKFDAATSIDGDITFALGTTSNLQASATQTYVVTNSGSANWTQHTITLAGGNHADTLFYGFYLSTDDNVADAIVYIDNVRFDSVEAFHGESITLSNCDYPEGFVPHAEATTARNATTVAEGLASTSFTVGADLPVDGTIAYHEMKTKDWMNGDIISLWVNVPAALDGQIAFRMGPNADLDNGALVDFPINVAAADTWEKFDVTLLGTEDLSAYYGFVLTSDVDGTFLVDGITCPANYSDNNDPMLAYAKDIVFTVGNALGGEPVDFTPTVDADQDGIISDETTKSHKVVISFSDSFTQVTDLAWTRTAVGTDDGDTLLEANEKFAITVDLSYVNDNTGALGTKQKITANHKFRIELKPHKGAVLTIERTLPIRVRNVMNLD